MTDFIEATSRDNDWRRTQVDVKNAKQGVSLRYWPYAGRSTEGFTARLALSWVGVDTRDGRFSAVIPEACLLLTLDEARALRDQAVSVVKAMEEEVEAGLERDDDD